MVQEVEMLRKFVSLMLFYSLLVMLISGVVLFIMPHGRVAYWTGWTFLGLDKDQWDNLHIIFGFLMLFFSFWHLLLNWRAIVNYFKSKYFLVSTLLTVIIAVGAVSNLPPFKNFIDFGEKIKNSWPKPATMPPAPHAELFPLSKVAQMVGLEPRQAVEVLRSRGIKVPSPNTTLKEIANLNNTTPARVYEILLEVSPKRSSSRTLQFQPGSGMGRFTLKEVCAQLRIPLNLCLERLRKRGIEAAPDSQLREIAFKNGLYPYQLIEILQGGKNGETSETGHE